MTPRAVSAAPPAPPRRAHTVMDHDLVPGAAASIASAAPVAGGAAARVAPAAQGRRIVGWMVSFDHLAVGESHLIHEGRTTIGRDRTNEVSTFFDEKTSGSHAEILYRNGQCALTDLRSSNGTFLNDEDIGIGTTRPLMTGDVVRVGLSSYLVYLIDLGQAAALWPAWQKGAK